MFALHNFIGSTEIYAHVDMSDVRKAVEKHPHKNCMNKRYLRRASKRLYAREQLTGYGPYNDT